MDEVEELSGSGFDDVRDHLNAEIERLTKALTVPPEKLEAAILAIHEGLGGNGWAYSNYGGDELQDCRDDLERAARAAAIALGMRVE